MLAQFHPTAKLHTSAVFTQLIADSSYTLQCALKRDLKYDSLRLT